MTSVVHRRIFAAVVLREAFWHSFACAGKTEAYVHIHTHSHVAFCIFHMSEKILQGSCNSSIYFRGWNYQNKEGTKKKHNFKRLEYEQFVSRRKKECHLFCNKHAKCSCWTLFGWNVIIIVNRNNLVFNECRFLLNLLRMVFLTRSRLARFIFEL